MALRGLVPGRLAVGSSATRLAVALAAGPALALALAGSAEALPSYTAELSVQPVTICSDSGATCWTPQYDAALLQSMYDPLGLLLVMQTPVTLPNFTFVDDFDGIDEGDALSDLRLAFGSDLSPYTAYMGGTPEMSGTTVGLAYVDAPTPAWAFGVVEAVASWSIETYTTLFAHELGHILGARHDGAGNTEPSSGFVMAPILSASSPPDIFSDTSLAEMSDSALFAPRGTFVAIEAAVPLPPAMALFAAGLLSLAGLRGWRTGGAGRRAAALSCPAGSS